MTTNTKRIHRMLLLWLDLQQAVRKCRSEKCSACGPWDCGDASVQAVWKRIIDSKNRQALEEWMFHAPEGEESVWAQQALLQCRANGEKGK